MLWIKNSTPINCHGLTLCTQTSKIKETLTIQFDRILSKPVTCYKTKKIPDGVETSDVLNRSFSSLFHQSFACPVSIMQHTKMRKKMLKAEPKLKRGQCTAMRPQLAQNPLQYN